MHLVIDLLHIDIFLMPLKYELKYLQFEINTVSWLLWDDDIFVRTWLIRRGVFFPETVLTEYCHTSPSRGEYVWHTCSTIFWKYFLKEKCCLDIFSDSLEATAINSKINCNNKAWRPRKNIWQINLHSAPDVLRNFCNSKNKWPR